MGKRAAERAAKETFQICTWSIQTATWNNWTVFIFGRIMPNQVWESFPRTEKAREGGRLQGNVVWMLIDKIKNLLQLGRELTRGWHYGIPVWRDWSSGMAVFYKKKGKCSYREQSIVWLYNICIGHSTSKSRWQVSFMSLIVFTAKSKEYMPYYFSLSEGFLKYLHFLGLVFSFPLHLSHEKNGLAVVMLSFFMVSSKNATEQ